MTGKIFINYRRGDDAGFTHALYLHLESEYASGDLFMDVEGHIKPGDDFFEVINAQIATCDVVLAVIGPRWAELLAERKGDPDDFVAIEIKAAFDQGKRVIPVLVGRASMPRADSLPEAIRPLARRNAVGLRPERFNVDCHGLVAALKQSLAAAEQERAARTEVEHFARRSTRIFEAPDKAMRALVFPSDINRDATQRLAHRPQMESRVVIRSSAGDTVMSKDYSSPSGEHGDYVDHGKWSPDSQFFVYSLMSSGGHSPWRMPIMVYSRKKERIAKFSDMIGGYPTLSGEFKFAGPHTLVVTTWKQPGALEDRVPISVDLDAAFENEKLPQWPPASD
jgi:TIR domain